MKEADKYWINNFITGHPNSTADKASREAVKVLRDEYETLEKALRKVKEVGHNNDCLFCGFKDRTVNETIGED